MNLSISQLKQNKYAKIIFAICFVLFYFFLMYLLKDKIHFRSDEYDNFLGGMVVANGGQIYKDFVSQHTPLMYYFCSLLYLIGIRTVVFYRLASYLLMAIVWACMFFRYKKHFGALPLILYPFFYVGMMYSGLFTHTIVSEQFQSQALIILLLEFLKFTRFKDLKLSDIIWISLSVFVSFGTAFVSIYPIFIITISVFAIEILALLKSEKETLKTETALSFKKAGLLIGAIALPFLILILIYIIQGNLQNAIFGIYTVNREYYPKYNGGFGTSIFSSFLHPINTFKVGFAYSTGINFPICIISVIFIALFIAIKHRRYLKGFTVLAFFYLNAMRDYKEFHGLPFLAVGMLCFSFLITIAIKKISTIEFKKVYIKKAICVCLILVCISPYAINILGRGFVRTFIIPNTTITDDDIIHARNEEIIKILTDDKEKIFDATINLYYVNTNRLPTTCAIACPWIYEAYKDKILSDLKENKPRVILLPENLDVWGHKAKDFAPEVYDYVYKEYASFKALTDSGDLYVRKDYYEEAKEKWFENN